MKEQEAVFKDDELQRENANARIREDGVAAELVRESELLELQQAMKAFYVHVKIVDIVALKKALRLREQGTEGGGTATLVDAFFKMLQDRQSSVSGGAASG